MASQRGPGDVQPELHRLVWPSKTVQRTDVEVMIVELWFWIPLHPFPTDYLSHGLKFRYSSMNLSEWLWHGFLITNFFPVYSTNHNLLDRTGWKYSKELFPIDNLVSMNGHVSKNDGFCINNFQKKGNHSDEPNFLFQNKVFGLHLWKTFYFVNKFCV